MRSKLLRVVMGLCLVVGVVLGCAGCGGDESGEYSIKITENGRVLATLRVEDLDSLEEHVIVVEGKEQTGPTLLSALESAGVRDFDTVTIKGLAQGRMAEAQISLDRDEIDDQVILDKSNEGTFKVTSPNIPKQEGVVDISEIAITR